MTIKGRYELPARRNMLCYAALPPQESFNETALRISERGFTELSLWLDAVERGIEENGGAAALCHYLSDCGLQVSVLEFLYSWPTATAGEHCAEAERYRDLAANLRSEVVMGGCFESAISDERRAIKQLREQCDILARADLKLAFEFLPWSAINTLPKALTLMAQVDRPNLGLVIDTWHFAKAGHTIDTLNLINDQPVYVVQFSDLAQHEDNSTNDDMLGETMSARLLPGEGVIDWPELSAWFRRHCQHAIFGPEVFNTRLKSAELGEALSILNGVCSYALQDNEN